MTKTFTIQEIKNYILSQDSLGDVLYYLTEANIEKANQPKKIDIDDINELEDEDNDEIWD